MKNITTKVSLSCELVLPSKVVTLYFAPPIYSQDGTTCWTLSMTAISDTERDALQALKQAMEIIASELIG